MKASKYLKSPAQNLSVFVLELVPIGAEMAVPTVSIHIGRGVVP